MGAWAKGRRGDTGTRGNGERASGRMGNLDEVLDLDLVNIISDFTRTRTKTI